MKSFFAIITCLVCILFVNCKKDSAECHYTLKIRNNSKNPVTYAVVDTYQSQCFVTLKSTIRPGEIYEDVRKECWEKMLEEQDVEFYLLQPSLTPLGTSALCDSGAVNPDIIEKFKLTVSDLDYLERTDYLFSYTRL